MAPVTCFGYQRSFVLIVATLIVPMTGVAAYPQHPHRASQPASSDPAWAELQQSMQSMHETMSSLESAGDADVDFIQLMLPHHKLRSIWRRFRGKESQALQAPSSYCSSSSHSPRDMTESTWVRKTCRPTISVNHRFPWLPPSLKFMLSLSRSSWAKREAIANPIR